MRADQRCMLLALTLLTPRVLALPRPLIDDERRSASHQRGALGAEHVYELNGVASVPSYGSCRLDLRVELTEIDRDPDGVRLVKLAIPQAVQLTDRNGLKHSLLRPYDVHTYPVYFRQNQHGQLVDILHHPRERWATLSMKRELISAQQLVGVPATTRRRAQEGSSAGWNVVEYDVGGAAEARYELYAHRHGWSVRKRLVYHEEET
jgi:hypothetical protein